MKSSAILGLYRGPVGKGPHVVPTTETPSIVLYRKNLARAVKTRAELTEQIRDTLLLETPESQPNALTRSSTFRVEVPVMYAVMITAHRALSIRRRGSSSEGRKLP